MVAARRVTAVLAPVVSRVRARCRTVWRAHWLDLTIGFALAMAAAWASCIGSGLIPPVLLSKDAIDVWFDADLSRVFDNMVSRTSDNKRTDVHPFFSLFAFACVYVLRAVTGLHDWTIVRLLLAAAAATSIALLYALLRCIGLGRAAAVVFALLAAVSSAGMFWFLVPETMPFAVVTILAGLMFVVIAARYPVSPAWGVALNLLTMGVTITNWVVGLLATAATYTRLQAVRIAAYAICIAIGLSALQLYGFPRATAFGMSNRIVAEESHFFLRKDAGSPIASAKTFLFHSMVMPKVQRFEHYWHWSKWPVMRVQLSGIGSGTAWGPIAALLWCGLLGLGIWSLVSTPAVTPLRWVLAGFLLFQGAFHVVFGRETFLYSPHFGPLLVVVAAFGMLSRWRHVSLALACALLATVTMNNGTVLRETLAFVDASRPPSAPLGPSTDVTALYQKTTPAADAAILLFDADGKVAGSVGPGGSFTVGDGGPRVSIWVAYQDAVVLASDVNWSPSTSQRLGWPWTGSPFVETNNWYYRVTAQAGEKGKWSVNIAQDDNLITRLLVLIRGPASGTSMSSLERVADGLVIDKRWTVALNPPAASVQIGEEKEAWRFTSRTDRQDGSTVKGYALLELDRRMRQWQLAIGDLNSPNPESGTRRP